MYNKILDVTFNLRIIPQQIERWRGAFAEYAILQSEVLAHKGLSDDLFHNKEVSAEGIRYLHRYSLIQYSERQGYAHITALGEGAKALKLLLKTPVTITWNRRPFALAVIAISERRINPAPKERNHLYRMNNWLPFNRKTFGEWKKGDSEIARLQLLERILTNQVLTLTQKGCGQEIGHRIKAVIVCKHSEGWVSYRDTMHKTFTLTFRMNTKLPLGLGLGKAVHEGWGQLLPPENPARVHRRHKRAEAKTERSLTYENDDVINQ